MEREGERRENKESTESSRYNRKEPWAMSRDAGESADISLFVCFFGAFFLSPPAPCPISVKAATTGFPSSPVCPAQG
jgi:hypothetical protein